jgi:hypothetical protein
LKRLATLRSRATTKESPATTASHIIVEPAEEYPLLCQKPCHQEEHASDGLDPSISKSQSNLREFLFLGMSYVTIIPLHQRNMYNKINTSLFGGHSLFATD